MTGAFATEGGSMTLIPVRMRAAAGRVLLAVAFGFAAATAAAQTLGDARVALGQGDDVMAPQLLRLLAEEGNADAQSILGAMYRKGRGVPQDETEAVKWFRKAAEQGNADAQYNLGVMYANGDAVPQDYVQAHMWLSLTAAQGDKDAVEARDRVAQRMTPNQIAEAQKLAREWKPKR
jgi:hypothetical protein